VNKLIIIDGHAVLHRAFHALPPLTNKRGEPINAVYGLVSMLLRVIQDLKPTYLTVCFDEKAPTFRHKEFPQYQAQRPVMLNELASQIERAKEVFSAMGVPIYSKAGYEADDVIGTITEEMSKDKEVDEVVVITGDKDQFQLVNNKVKLYVPIVGLSSAKLMGPAEVKEKMGVEPGKIADYKALVGDPSDNYFGVSGIGPKTAINLLTRFGTLQEIYKNLKEISPQVREKLVKGKESARLSLKLATIVKNVPIDFDLEKGKKWDIDGQKVLEVFADLGFKTLTERVKKVGQEMDAEKQGSLFN
jgi:DNA polymerase-1